MNILKSFWGWLSGKKRTIALIYWSIITPSIMILWPVQVPSVVSKTSAIVGLVLSAIGLGHAAVKKYVNGKQVDNENEEDMEQPLPPDEPAK